MDPTKIIEILKQHEPVFKASGDAYSQQVDSCLILSRPDQIDQIREIFWDAKICKNLLKAAQKTVFNALWFEKSIFTMFL